MPPPRTSIADCDFCSRIPQKLIASATGSGSPVIPQDVGSLLTVVQAADSRLLKCPVCATYYFYSRDHQERDICTQESTDITVRRYGPVEAIEFLERLGAGSPTPMTVGQFSRELLGGGDVPAAAEGTSKEEIDKASRELAELASRYDAIIADLQRILRADGPPAWPVMVHAVESLCAHFVARGDWDSLSSMLLKHPDLLVRTSAASLLTNVGLKNLSTFDFMHTPVRVRAGLEAELSKQARFDELRSVLRAIEQGPGGETREYSFTGYRRTDVRDVARQALALLEKHPPGPA